MTNNRGFIHESTYNESKEWYTPKYIFDALGLTFDLDPCSPGADVIPWIPARQHLTLTDNGRNAPWHGSVWMNPPYGSDTPKWMEHLAAHGNGIALVFSRTDVKWFHKYIPKADAICFIKGRVQFIPADRAKDYSLGIHKPTGGCGAGSMLVAYGPEMASALFKSKLGLTLPVISHTETHRAGERFAGDKLKANPVQATTASLNENLPRNDEHRQSIINAAVSALRKRRTQQ
ncbi:MAG TPA: DNA N-6-adenine-methyltransferase [Desulfosporosinus sp.]|nr:DNA N-6-adenine-methyltransferase [Desulfosporosinus sp.]